MVDAHESSIELWNLHDGVTARVGAQQYFNVLGRLGTPERTVTLEARLNGSDWRPVPVNLTAGSKARLRSPGDFNIDWIDIDALRPSNLLDVRQSLANGERRQRQVTFQVEHSKHTEPVLQFEPCPGNIEELAQVVDGRWQVALDGSSTSLRMTRDDAGYDRILLFGDRTWTSGYEVDAVLTVDSWTHYVHNVGLVFKWQPHRASRGTKLPSDWTTGLAYYASTTPGLRLRFGVDVRFEQGKKLGDHVLRERPLRWWTRRPRWLLRACWYATGGRVVLSQLRTGVPYRFRARIDPTTYSLTVWPATEPAPPPQVLVPDPPELIGSGSVGVIAQNAAVRIHSFRVRPLETGARRGVPGQARRGVTAVAAGWIRGQSRLSARSVSRRTCR